MGANNETLLNYQFCKTYSQLNLVNDIFCTLSQHIISYFPTNQTYHWVVNYKQHLWWPYIPNFTKFTATLNFPYINASYLGEGGLVVSIFLFSSITQKLKISRVKLRCDTLKQCKLFLIMQLVSWCKFVFVS